MTNNCTICGVEIKGFYDSVRLRRYGYCPEHLPDEFKCTWDGCDHPRLLHADYCFAHRKQVKKLNKEKNKIKNGVGKVAPKDYEKYIKSSAWRSKSRAIRKKYGDRCRLCNRTGVIHSHHRTYERLGNEDFDDLTPLCEDCHNLFSNNFTYDSKTNTFKPNHPIPPYLS